MSRESTFKSSYAKRSLLLLNFAILGGVACILVLSIFLWQGANLLSLSIALSFSLCLAPFIFYKMEPSPLAPIYLTMIYLAISYPGKLLAVRNRLDYVEESFRGLLWNDELVIQTIFLLIIGLLAFFIGYYRTPQSILNKLAKLKLSFGSEIDRSWPYKVFMIAVIGWGSVLVQILIGSWSTFAGLGDNWNPNTNQLFSYLFNYVWYAFIAAGLWVFSKNNFRSDLKTIACLGLIAVTILFSIFFLGSKTWLVYPIFWLFAAAYVVGRRPSIVLSIATLLIVMIIAFSFVSIYRSAYLENFGKEITISSEIFDFTKNLEEDIIENTKVDTSVGHIFTRFGGIDAAVRTISLVPNRYDYHYFRDFPFVFFNIIPRIIWSDKPLPYSGSFFSIYIYGMTSGGSASPHPVAEGYLNLGWLGVLMLFWLWGLMQALLYRGIYLPHSRLGLIGTLYLFYFLQVIGFGGWLSGFIAGLPQQIIVLLPLIFIFRSFGRRRKTSNREVI